MLRTLSKLYKLLSIKLIRTSVYHPQTDSLVEQFNHTLKSMVWEFLKEDAKKWDKAWFPVVYGAGGSKSLYWVFPIWASLWSSARGVLDVIREAWEDEPSNRHSEIHSLFTHPFMSWTSKKNSTLWGGSQCRICSRLKTNKVGSTTGGTQERRFTPGEKVLVLLLTLLLARTICGYMAIWGSRL